MSAFLSSAVTNRTLALAPQHLTPCCGQQHCVWSKPGASPIPFLPVPMFNPPQDPQAELSISARSLYPAAVPFNMPHSHTFTVHHFHHNTACSCPEPLPTHTTPWSQWPFRSPWSHCTSSQSWTSSCLRANRANRKAPHTVATAGLVHVTPHGLDPISFVSPDQQMCL